MNKTVEAWLNIWLYVMAVAGAVLAAVLIQCWGRFDWIQRLMIMTDIVLVLHVWEEWRYPAGFAYMYNTLFKSERPDRYPMNQLTDMITNFGALLVFTGGIILFPGAVWIGTAMFLFCLMEVFAHTAFGIKMKNKFRDRGKRTIYNPGYASTMLGFLPIAFGFWYWLMAKKTAVWVDWVAGLAVSIVVFLALIVLPEALFRNEDSPYPFTGKYEFGYFKKFLD